jgi:hypothetical protein
LSAALHDILDRLADLGAEVELQADKLILRAGTAPVPGDILATIRVHKAEILEALSEDALRTAFAERSQIIEHEGHIPREWAEGSARLNPNHAPGDVPLRRWQRFVDDVGSFLDSPFRAVAVALGWGPYDLFGSDTHKPFARLDKAGLLWALNGNKLVALSGDTAIIKMQTGARQTYRRKQNGLRRVLAWELRTKAGTVRPRH